MKIKRILICLFLLTSTVAKADESLVLLEESFQGPLSKEWFWGLGTWKAEKGVLRGYESGPRRHGPVKMRRFVLGDGIVDFEFRLEGKAKFAGIIFNGSQERGHIVHLVVSRDQVRILGHAKKGKSENLLQKPHRINAGQWYRVRVQFNGTAMTAMVNDKEFTVKADYIAERKLTFGLGGDSGGPEGEKAGALEFRNLRIKPSVNKKQTGIGAIGDVRQVHSGFQFTEGPAANAKGNVYFSDLRTEKAYRVGVSGELTTFLEDSLRTNGLFFHPDGRLYACQSGSQKTPGAPSQIVAYDVARGDYQVVADACEGKSFYRVNDLVLDSSGGVYFSDIGGSKKNPGPSSVFYCSPEGKVTKLVSDVLRCNGVLLSPDERTLYVLPSGQAQFLAYPIKAPGQIGPGRDFGALIQREGQPASGGDGLTVDVQGNLYVTRPRANCIQVFGPEGDTRAVIPFPEGPANCTFGGPDRRTLYVTAKTSLYAVKMPIPGFQLTKKQSLSEKGRSKIRAEIQAVINEGYYPGISVLLIHRGKVIMREAHGVVNIKSKKPFTVDQLCWLASTGKIFTATLMASLVDEGLLSFEDPISKTFPKFSEIRLQDGTKPKQPVRIRHALSHTTGIPNDRWLKSEKSLDKNSPQLSNYFFPGTPQDFVDGCLNVGLVNEPGTRMLYGRPIDLSACVAEKITGKTFVELMQNRVFKPLELNRSTIQPTAEELKQLAPLYQSNKPGVFEPDSFALEVADRQNKRLSTAGGGVYTTLDDLGMLMQLHLNRGIHKGKQIIRAETLQKLYQPQSGTNGRYGLAFQIHKSGVNGNSRILSHPGYSGPVAWVDFERELVGVLLMQSNTVNRSKHHQRIIDTIYRLIPAVKPLD
ncbi:MAG: serine hydrolase [Planctomycetes bacterium]|nr:serine hydrolase [Planctomycetota bacterium]MCH9727384.1 serine hydrolase [Planctomycetota bacterium]MCH9778006.1 serine hydrolase [Planctomycetota bacterium]